MDAVKYFFLCLLTYWHIRWFSFCTWWNDSLIFAPSILCGYDGKSVTQKRVLHWPCRYSALKTSSLKNCEKYVSVILSYLVCGIFYSRPKWDEDNKFFFSLIFFSLLLLFLFFPSLFMSLICCRKSDIFATDWITIWVRSIASVCFVLTWTSIPRTASLSYRLN